MGSIQCDVCRFHAGANYCSNCGRPSRGEGKEIRIRFDGPPGPEGPRLIDVEDGRGRSFNVGRWERDPDSGDFFLVIPG